MAISDKLNYLIETKQLFKDRLNSLGAEITSSTTFRNYLTWLDTFYGEVSDKTDLSVNGVVGRTSQNTAILPSEYTQVDYIESSGTQYIDTGVKGNQDTKTEIKFEITNLDYDGNKSFVGARRNASSNHYGITLANGQPTATLFSGYNTSSINTSIRLSLNTEYKIVKDKNILYLDGTQILEQTYENFETPANMYIFAMHQEGATFYSSIRLFNLKLYNDNILIRDFIPCYRNSDNEVGLYDLVNNVFYTNQGTGVFTYGSVVSIPNPDYPQPINNLSGDVAYKVSGKNSFDGILELGNFNTETGKKLDNNNYIINTNPIPVEELTNYKISSNGTGIRTYVFEYKEDMTYNLSTRKTVNDNEYLTTNSGTKYINFRTIDVNTNLQEKIQVEKDSTVTTYEPYIEPQTFDIPLGDIELCKIDTYEDKIYSSDGRFYLEKNIQKITVNGSEENWARGAIQDYYRYTLSLDTLVSADAVLIYSNYYRGIAYNNRNSDYFNTIYANGNIGINTNVASTLTEWKSWLSNNNLTAYYVLATPTTTEITEENYPSLYNALKQIQDYLTAYKINKEFILGYSSPEIEY